MSKKPYFVRYEETTPEEPLVGFYFLDTEDDIHGPFSSMDKALMAMEDLMI